jgi:hypothetical protein
MWGDRYFGPVEDTGQFIAEVTSALIASGVTDVRDAPVIDTVVNRLPSYVFIPVEVTSSVERPQSAAETNDVSVIVSGTTSASGPVARSQSESYVTSEVRYFTLAVVKSDVNERAN